VDSAPAMGRRGGVGRGFGDAPEIDGVVRLLPPEKLSKNLKVGEFTRARIVSVEGHDLVGVPVWRGSAACGSAIGLSACTVLCVGLQRATKKPLIRNQRLAQSITYRTG